MNEQSAILAQLADAVVCLNPELVVELTRKALEQNIPPERAMADGLAAGMQLVGRRFAAHECFVPQVLLAAKAMYSGFDILKEQVPKAELQAASLGKVALGVVQGDIHDIGKNIVKVLVQAAGFEVLDLGRNAPDSAFIRAAESGCRVIGISSLMTTTMPRMGVIIEALDKAGLRKETKVIVGGAPVTDGFARSIGADGYAPDAYAAVAEFERLITEQ